MNSSRLKTGETFRRFGLGKATHRSTDQSAVTSAWGVDWSEELIARDLMQNFFDANRKALEKVIVTADDRHIKVSAPAQFGLRHLFFLGSEKGEEDVGKYGEGFKAASICILRRKNTTVLAASGNDGVIIRLSDEPAPGTSLYPLLYDFFDLERPVGGSVLIIDGAWRELSRAMESGLSHFFHEGNPLIGEKLLDRGPDFRLYRSTTGSGHIFYRNLRRGDIPDLPVVLVLNKPYARIEKEVAKDRDRKAFGDEVREIFYSVWAKSFFTWQSSQRHVVAAAKPIWEQGRGHPLLAAIARPQYGHWPSSDAERVFGKQFYAESSSSDARELIQFNEIEELWNREGRRKLPAYFSAFGVISARRHIEEIHETAKAEARKKGAHRPTPAESAAIAVLRDVLRDFAPKIAQFYEEKRTSYTIAATEVLLGEFKQARGYRSHEIFLAERIFESDFAEALAVFLHEHAHIHGYDGSRTFTDALTELLETTVRQRMSIGSHEAKWTAARDKVVAERKRESQKRQADELAQLDGFDREELLALVRDLPQAELRSALRRRQRTGKKG